MGPHPKKRERTKKELHPMIDMLLAPFFGRMTTAKLVTADPGIVPEWRTKAILGNLLRKQVRLKKMAKGSIRQRDVDQEKYRRIVDGRTSASPA